MGADADALQVICITLPSDTSLSRRTAVQGKLFRAWSGWVLWFPTGTSRAWRCFFGPSSIFV